MPIFLDFECRFSILYQFEKDTGDKTTEGREVLGWREREPEGSRSDLALE
jgi:hypothetical protein